jgi:hypothetical protein
MAMGGFVGDALGKPGADLIKKYLEDFGSDAGKKLIEEGADSFAGKLKKSAPDLACLYREARHLALPQHPAPIFLRSPAGNNSMEIQWEFGPVAATCS